jgi:hypothetical protein
MGIRFDMVKMGMNIHTHYFFELFVFLPSIVALL